MDESFWRDDGPLRLNIEPEDAGAGLGRLVVVLLDLVRQLLEREALRRVDAGGLTPEQVDRLGRALLALDVRFAELREVFSDDRGRPVGSLTTRDAVPAPGEPPGTGTTPTLT